MARRALVSQKNLSADSTQLTLRRAEAEQYAEEWLLHDEWQQRAISATETRRVVLKNFLCQVPHGLR